MSHLAWHSPNEIDELREVLSRESVKSDPEGSFICSATRAAILVGGLTNRLYCIDTPEEGMWVVRVSGENYEVHNIDRVKEYKCIKAAFEAGITPDAKFIKSDLITISRFISHGHTWDNDTVQKNIVDCVDIVKVLHSIPLDKYSDHVFDAWEVCDHYHQIALEKGAPLPDDIDEIYAIMRTVKAAVDEDKVASFPLVACHNDLLAANWIKGRMNNVEKVWLIDYDYACTGDLFFDLANLCSNCDFSREQDILVVESYFNKPEAALFNIYMARLQLFRIMSNLRESMWSYVQWGISRTCSPRFYDGYGAKMFDRVRVSVRQPEFNEWLDTLKNGLKK